MKTRTTSSLDTDVCTYSKKFASTKNQQQEKNFTIN